MAFRQTRGIIPIQVDADNTGAIRLQVSKSLQITKIPHHEYEHEVDLPGHGVRMLYTTGTHFELSTIGERSRVIDQFDHAHSNAPIDDALAYWDELIKQDETGEAHPKEFVSPAEAHANI